MELLNENGQLIFICLEYWMNTTHSISLRNYMVDNGHFEEIYHFNETPIFSKVTVSIIIFKFVKSKNKSTKIKVAKFYANQKLTSETLQKLKYEVEIKDATYLKVTQFETNERWLLLSDDERQKLCILENNCLKKSKNVVLKLFTEQTQEYNTIGEFCDIGNSLVSALDKAFQVIGHVLTAKETKSILSVIIAKDLKPFFAESITKYIFINEGLDEIQFSIEYPNYYNHFQKHKEDLGKRYQYNSKINYWEWVFLRNFNLFNNHDKRIFVPCKERISNKNYFRFALVDEGIFPTQDVTAIFKKYKVKESIDIFWLT